MMQRRVTNDQTGRGSGFVEAELGTESEDSKMGNQSRHRSMQFCSVHHKQRTPQSRSR